MMFVKILGLLLLLLILVFNFGMAVQAKAPVIWGWLIPIIIIVFVLLIVRIVRTQHTYIIKYGERIAYADSFYVKKVANKKVLMYMDKQHRAKRALTNISDVKISVKVFEEDKKKER